MIARTYGSRELAGRLLDNLTQAGCDAQHLTTTDLRAFDELHVMGREATVDLARWAQLRPEMRVLDVGCGLGGTARNLVESVGGRFSGVDLSPAFVQAASELTRRVGLAGQITYTVGNAYKLPFADSVFDAACMIHVNMNLADKIPLWQEALRVLKPGGILAMWELCQGQGPAVIYPVPWANDPSFSHLIGPVEMEAGLNTCGFEPVVCETATDTVIQWIKARQTSRKPPGQKPPQVDLNLILPDFLRKRMNIAKNILQGSLAVVRCKAIKPPPPH